jgi:hypothetical protein
MATIDRRYLWIVIALVIGPITATIVVFGLSLLDRGCTVRTNLERLPASRAGLAIRS